MAANAAQLRRQAKLSALLKYEPQRQAIQQLALEAKQNAVSAVQGAASTGRLTTAAVNKAIPAVQGIYDRAAGTSAATTSQLGAALAALGPQAAGFQGAASTEAAAGSDRLARERAAREGNLQEQKLAAAEAPQFARTLAQQQLGSTLSKLQQSYQSLAGSEGAAAQSSLESLLNQAEGRATTERGQNLTSESAAASRKQSASQAAAAAKQKREEHGEDLSQARQLAEEKGEITLKIHNGTRDANGFLPIKEQSKVRGLYGDAYFQAKTIKEQSKHPQTVQSLVRALQQPVPDRTSEDAEGNKQTTKGHVGFDNKAYLHAAVEEVLYGGVSQQTLRGLHEEGLDPHRFAVKGRPAPKPYPNARER